MGKNINLIPVISTLFGLLITAYNTFAAEAKSTGSPWAKTEVIADRGGYPIDSYLPGHNKRYVKAKANFEKRRSTKLVNAHFPVVTSSMSVGKVGYDEAKDIKYQVAMRPMFIIGYDPVSISWLKTNKELLADKKAIGLVVNVENKEQMDALQEIVGNDVMMQPTPGDRLAEHLKIKHYPFYMDNQGVMR
ncbi:integrating conjugative element protein (plasmid) [Microbulbifer sp. TRSA002]|uniref:integrating conjugative element protein n=1 Tax=Microbulbifer sp. TRSA002 TaxID=3243382 RepID=UPI00403912BF